MSLASSQQPIDTAAAHRGRARRLMAAAGIDALVVVQPENFRYITGAHPGFASSWRRAGTQIAILAADETLSPAVIVGDAIESLFRARSSIAEVKTHPLWVDFVDVEPLMATGLSTPEIFSKAAMRDQASLQGGRPGTYDMKRVVDLLCDLLSARKLLDAKLGFEFDFLPTSDFMAFRAALPKAEFCDSSGLFRELRLLKEPEEVALLRTACRLTEIGISKVVDGLTAGLSTFDISVRYRSSVMEEAARRGVTRLEALWGFNTFGPHTFGRASGAATLQPGDGVKFDCGCTIDGYTSDIGRTFVFGKGSKHQRGIQQALIEAWEAGLEHFRPGESLRSVHHAAQQTMRRLGYPAYTRGHVGHGIGSSVWLEEWPYISGDADLIIQPNMVFSYELPYYINGIGSFIIEDQLVITEQGPQSMNALSKNYLEVS